MSMSPTSLRRNDEGHEVGAAKKRRRGATRLSCAECRRLKLRCDRTVPCGSCVKRGCGAICPDGSLTTGQGNRFVLASTQELHEKISELSLRVRELEDGLRVSHSKTAADIHPLLSDELLKIKAPLQREPPGLRNGQLENGIKEEEEPKLDVVDAIGSLSISDSGRTKYFGHTANSWYFLQNESPEEEPAEDRLSQLSVILPPEILTLTGSFPIIRMVQPDNSLPVDRLQNLYHYLPNYDIATRLRDIYYRNAAWMYDPVPIDYFNEQVFFKLYMPDERSPVEEDLLSPRLSLMFMVLAIGTLMDTKQAAYNLDAEKYHHLSRAALFQSSLFDEPSLNSVQALFLMSFYLFLSDRHGTGAGSRWAIMGMAVKLAQSIGLHRDIGKWKVDPTETMQRRNTFWELYTYDSWQCLTFGRPPSFSLAHVDCKMVQPNELDPEQAFHAWKHRFVSECMSVVHDQAFGAKAPTYSTVVQLDRKLRAFPVPAILQIAGFGSTGSSTGSDASANGPVGYPESVQLILQRHIVLAIREMNLLYMHRSFFARALSDHPKDPLGSPYGTSVIAAYRSAGSLVALMRNLHSQLTDLTERIFFLWTHMFSCAIILGSIVTRCPSMSLAPSALLQLDSACELFAKAARGFRAQKILTIMLRLKERAHSSLAAFKEGKSSPTALRLMPPSEPATPVEDDDELSMLGGKTRVVARKESGSPPSMRSPTTLNPVVPLPLTPNTDHQVHPTVVEYLRSFEPPMDTSMTGSSLHAEPSQYHGASQLSIPYTGNNAMATSYEQQSPVVTTNGNGYTQAPYFPQYFPVYDYAPTTNGVDYTYASSSMPQMNGYISTERERGSVSPEASMHATWQDFVDGFTMA